MRIKCSICPHECSLSEGQIGLCRARVNRDGKIACDNYGQTTAYALDPIEKKPLMRFHPGSKILSVGSYGCNMRCPFCQNSDISVSDVWENNECEYLSPENLVFRARLAAMNGSIGIAYTYNEPLIGFEYVYDCAKIARVEGLNNVVVTNGMINQEPLLMLLPFIDAMNIDLKGFTEEFYNLLGGNIKAVKNTIKTAVSYCHVEITTLIIPGKNDSREEMDALSAWLSSISPEIPLHISRFFPRWKYQNYNPTPIETINNLADIARKHLKYVYKGNC